MRFISRSAVLGAAALVALLAYGTAEAHLNKCESTKIKCAGKKAGAKLKNESKSAKKNEPIPAEDTAKAELKFSECYTKVEGKQDITKPETVCPSLGDTASMEAKVDAFVADVIAELGAPTGAANKCLATKIKCAGKKAAGKLKNEAKSHKKGEPIPAEDTAKVELKFNDCYDKVELKQDPAPGKEATVCPAPDGDKVAIEAKVDAFVADVVAELGGAPPPPALCPTVVTFVPTAGALGVLDAGWTGQSHDAQVVGEAKVTVSVSCPDPQPDCGICTYTGPLPNATGFDNKRCTCDTRVSCSVNADCPGSCACRSNFGSYLPLSAGGVATCVKNEWKSGPTGTFDEVTGDSAGVASVISTVFSGPTGDEPCPKCVGDPTPNDQVTGGTCTGSGEDTGDPCDVNGTHPNVIFGATSMDCRPLAGGVLATLDIDLTNTTGAFTRTLSAASPSCTAPGFGGSKCHCDTCATLAAQACDENADCPGGAICGGLRCIGGTNAGAACPTAGASSVCPGGACGRPGFASKPNDCDLGVGDCAPDGGNEMACVSGPFEQFCTPSATHKACAVNADCPAGDTCVGKFRNCYNNGVIGESVTATGVVDAWVGNMNDPTFAALFCINPVGPAVNAVAGLPGLGRLELPGHAEGNGTGP